MSGDNFFFNARKQFPDSAIELLKVINKISRQQTRLSTRFLLGLQTCVDEHLFCLIECKGVFSTKLSSIQELQLIHMLCKCFEDRTSSTTNTTRSDTAFTLLELIFFSSEMNPALAEARCEILAKTISLAAQLRCIPLLNDISAWMQKACTTPSRSSASSSSSIGIPTSVKKICAQLVKDYCDFGPLPLEDSTNSSSNALYRHRLLQRQRVVLDLATSSPSLIPYITAATMGTYDWFTTPSLPIFEVLTDWICSHAAALLKPFKDWAKFSNSTSMAFFRFLSQAFGKLLCLCLTYAAGEPNNLSSLYGRLQLGLLRLMEMAPKFIGKLESDETPCAIMTTRMVTDVLKMVQQQRDSQPQYMQNACYALFRALQVAVGSGCFMGTKRELEQALAPYFSDYPFLQFVLNEYFV